MEDNVDDTENDFNKETLIFDDCIVIGEKTIKFGSKSDENSKC